MTVYNLVQGGLGNRLMALQSAIHLSKLLETNLVVCWPVNDECGLALNKILDTEFEEVTTLAYPEKGFVRLGLVPKHITDYPQFDHVTPILFDTITETEPFLKSLKHVDVYFSDWRIRQFTVFHPLKFKDEYVQKANDFVLKNNIQVTLHIRATDCGYKQSVLDEMKSSGDLRRICYHKGKFCGNIFVTSDEKRYEEEFSQEANRVTRTDKSWPTKRDESRPFLMGENIFNIRRSEQNVVDAIIDMLVMSKTPMIYGNTYSSLAKYAHLLYVYENPGSPARYLEWGK